MPESFTTADKAENRTLYTVGSMGLSGYEMAEGLVELAANWSQTVEALEGILGDPAVRAQMGEAMVAEYEERLARQTRAFEEAGWEGSVVAGVEAGRLAMDIFMLGSGVAGTAKVAAQAIAKLSSSAARAVAVVSAKLGSVVDNIYAEMKSMEAIFPELKGVNPHYVENAAVGVNTNCISCVNAAHQRLTGQNPTAVANPSKGYGNRNDLLPSTPLGFSEDTMTPAEVIDVMSQAGHGATRPLIINQNSEIGHVINVVNRNGQVYFIDPQIGKVVTLRPDVSVNLGNPGL